MAEINWDSWNLISAMAGSSYVAWSQIREAGEINLERGESELPSIKDQLRNRESNQDRRTINLSKGDLTLQRECFLLVCDLWVLCGAELSQIEFLVKIWYICST